MWSLILALVGLQDPELPGAELPRVEVTRWGQVVEASCVLVFPDEPLTGGEGPAVELHGDGLRVECVGELRGAADGMQPDGYAGVGLRLVGEDIELVAAKVSGFRVGVLAEACDGARLRGLDVRDNFRQRLRSTFGFEDSRDWLEPHVNDGGEWLERYGAGLAVRDSERVLVERLLARDVQNGIVLERVEQSVVRLCDASYLSGWGLALWRSSDNRVVGNRFDYCVRGYSYGRYNRGQDSAGVLLFEQSCDNRFELNSITHGGDGVFGFAGREALGELGDPQASHRRLGCNGNVFRHNDLSSAAAHGLELTFSFDNLIESNWFEDNAICGAWLGYGRDSQIRANVFRSNGAAGYGAERGGINAEHAQRLEIVGNRFEENAVGVRLWTDADPHLAGTPWVRDNGAGARDNRLLDNRFVEQELALELQRATGTAIRPALGAFQRAFDEASLESLAALPTEAPDTGEVMSSLPVSRSGLQTRIRAERGEDSVPVGWTSWEPTGRGREAILMGEWGPHDHDRPFTALLEQSPGRHGWLVNGGRGVAGADLEVKALGAQAPTFTVRSMPTQGTPRWAVEVQPQSSGKPLPYALSIRHDAFELECSGVLTPLDWEVTAFAWTADPREDLTAWRKQGRAARRNSFQLDRLELAFGQGGPSAYAAQANDVPADRFGLLASSEFELPTGHWRLHCVSDDGVRVRLDKAVLIERWDRHGPTVDRFEFEQRRPKSVTLEVEYFELDGNAELVVALEPAEPAD